MDNNLSYQKARLIRNQSLSSLLSDEIIQGSGVFSGIKKVVSLKTQAKIKGIKEKFDPLNIARVLTGGSRLGPALLGKLTGRSRKDIENFAGRVKYVNDKNKKISALPSSEQESSGMKSVLISIVSLLKKTFDEDKKRREKESNFAEERKLEDDKRHKELLTALGVIRGGTATSVQGKTESKGFFQSIFDTLSDLMSMKNLLKPILNLLSTAGSWLIELLAGGTAWIIGAVLGSAAIGYFLDKYLEENRVKSIKERGGEEALTAQNVRIQSEQTSGLSGQMPESADENKIYAENLVTENAAIKEKTELVEQLMAKKGYPRKFAKTVLGMATNERIYVSPDGKKEAPETLVNQVSSEADNIIKGRRKQGEQNKYLPKSMTPAKPAPTAIPAGVTGGSTTPNIAPVPATSGSTPSIPTPPLSQKLNSVIKENVSLNLDSSVSKAQQDTVNNNIVNKKNNPTRNTPMPSVRNQDDTFQRMIVNSTRVV